MREATPPSCRVVATRHAAPRGKRGHARNGAKEGREKCAAGVRSHVELPNVLRPPPAPPHALAAPTAIRISTRSFESEREARARHSGPLRSPLTRAAPLPSVRTPKLRARSRPAGLRGRKSITTRREGRLYYNTNGLAMRRAGVQCCTGTQAPRQPPYASYEKVFTDPDSLRRSRFGVGLLLLLRRLTRVGLGLVRLVDLLLLRA